MLGWIIIIVCYLLFIAVISLFITFLRNVKKEKAKIVSDKFSIIFIAIITLFFFVFQIYFTIIGIKTDFKFTSPIFELLIGLPLYMLAKQNVFAYSRDLFIIGFKKYNKAQLDVNSIKMGIDNRVSIKIINSQSGNLGKKIRLSLSEKNYRKYGALFLKK